MWLTDNGAKKNLISNIFKVKHEMGFFKLCLDKSGS